MVQSLLVSGELKPNDEWEGPWKRKLIALGSDLTPRLQGVQGYLGHALDVFGSVTTVWVVRKAKGFPVVGS
jgi:hypothetical protein